MKQHIRTLTAALCFLPAPVFADMEWERPPPDAAGQFWGIGATGIMCFRAPCPWRGVFAYDPESTRPITPNAVNPLLPRLIASDADKRTIDRAWDDFRCVIVEGRFEDGKLRVERVTGAC